MEQSEQTSLDRTGRKTSGLLAAIPKKRLGSGNQLTVTSATKTAGGAERTPEIRSADRLSAVEEVISALIHSPFKEFAFYCEVKTSRG